MEPDQPWKEGIEGAVGCVLGRLTTPRAAQVPVHRADRAHAGAAHARRRLGRARADRVGIVFVNSRHLRTRAAASAVVVYATATAAVWVFYDYSQQYLTISSVLIGLLMFLGTIGVILVLFAEAHEWAEARWVTARQRLLHAAPRQRRVGVAAGAAQGVRCTCRRTTSRRRW